MQARTAILLGVLAGTVVVVRHTSHADEVVPEFVARRDVPPQSALPPPPPAPSLFRAADVQPSLAPEAVALKAALAQVLEDGPTLEATGDPHAAVGGNVRDVITGETVAGVVVIATSPALEHPQTAFTDENGDYAITELPPGEYLLTFYYADITMERPGIVLDAGSSLHFPLVLDPDERPHVASSDPPVNIPVPGRVFEDALGGAAGSQCDCDGVSFTGVTSVDNTYVVDE